MQTLKQKIISAITGGTMILGGFAVSDVAIESPTEKLETALIPYGLVINDIVPFPSEKIEIAKQSQDFTENEKAVLEATLKGEIPLWFSDGNINVNEIQNIYADILNKLELKYEDLKDTNNTIKLIRQKYE